MMKLNYKVVQYQTEYKAVCVELPSIQCIAATRIDALLGVEEQVFRYLLDKGFQFGITKSVY